MRPGVKMRRRLLRPKPKAGTTTEQFAQIATREGGFFDAEKDELSDSVIIIHGMGKEEQAPVTARDFVYNF